MYITKIGTITVFRFAISNLRVLGDNSVNAFSSRYAGAQRSRRGAGPYDGCMIGIFIVGTPVESIIGIDDLESSYGFGQF